MGYFSTDALVLREVRYKEADKILTVFTADRGIVTAKARGALRKNSLTAAAAQQLTLSEMTFFENRGRLTVHEAVVKEAFTGLRKNIEAYSLGCAGGGGGFPLFSVDFEFSVCTLSGIP